MHHRFLSARAIALAGCWLLCLAPVAAFSAHPAAARLLPRSTVLFIRIPDVQTLKEQLPLTALGRITHDPQMQPFAEKMYGSLATAWTELKTEIDLPLNQLLDIPQGEVTLALVARETGDPVWVGLIDVGDHLPAAQKVLDRGKAALEQAGATKKEETVADTVLAVYDLPAGQGVRAGRRRLQQFAVGVKQNTILLASDLDALKQVVNQWEGKSDEKAGALADNPSYGSMMKALRATRDADTQLTVFVDPIGMVKALTQDNLVARAGLALLPTIGLDGLRGVGGSLALGHGEFDYVYHLHLLLDQPRTGALEALALGSGDITPERWVPADAARYTTVYWDLTTTNGKIAALFDSFQGDGTWSRQLKDGISSSLGADLETEILPALAGRFTVFSWIERPIKTDSGRSLWAAKLKDPAAFEKTLEKIADHNKENLEKKSYAGVTCYYIKLPEPPADRARQPKLQPCLAIFAGYLMAADRASLLEKVIRSRDDNSKSLADELDFKLIASKASRQSGGAKPGLFTFERPEEGMRLLYEMAVKEKNPNPEPAKPGRARGIANNPLFKSWNKTIEEQPLPPFEVIAKYLAPGGGVLTDDETGLHYTGFALRRSN